ncbi:retropepsin-like aspartic protease [Asaia sp. BMEF1]|uniref:aspartyl protease family protein n=1 Tax=Asaia sp. BMEF1 TaxID=3155932 RepID=UPI003F660F16
MPMKNAESARHRQSIACSVLLLGITLLTGCDAPVKDGTCTIGTIGRLPLYSSHNVPVVRATINKHPVLFEVDTGAFNSVLSEQYADKLDLNYSEGMVRAIGVKGTEFQRVVQVDHIGLGGATNTNHAFTMTSQLFHPTKPPLPPLVGLMGAEILLATDLVIDMPHHQMQLLDMKRCPYPAPLWKGAMHTVPIDRNLDDMKLHVHFALDGGEPIRAVFDTGASRTVIPLRMARKLGVTDAMLKNDRSTTDVQAVGDDKVTAYHHRFRTLTLGDFTIHNPEVIIMDNDTLDYALFGADFLRHHRVWITTENTMYVQHISEIPRDENQVPPSSAASETGAK